MPTDSQDPQDKAHTETRDYVWNYWAFHAEQRLRTFHFFILIATVLVAGILTYVKEARYPLYASPAGFLLAAVCYIFWRIDCRNRVLIRHAERILKAIEQSIPVEQVPAECRLFVEEDLQADAAAAAHGARSPWAFGRWWHAPLSFYHAFRLLFVVFGLCGVAIGIAAFFLPAQPPVASPATPQQNFYIGGQATKPALGNSP